MQQSHSTAFHQLIHQIEKLRRQLQYFTGRSCSSFSQKKTALQKRYHRCLQKLAKLASPAIKAGVSLGLSTMLTISSSAQNQTCNTFYNVVRSNPIKRVPLPYNGLGKPAFVDIDGDGDYDCYEEYYDSFNNGHILFLCNNGTKEVPYFEQDTASGFQSNLTLDLGPYPFEIGGAAFVDIDGDGDYDCLLGAYVGGYEKIRYFENTGNAEHPIFTERTGSANPFNFVYGYYGLDYALADLDGDGDYDFVMTNYAYEIFYKNVGTITYPSFELVKRKLDDFAGHITFYDWNQDGLIDYFDALGYHKNTGTAKHPKFKSDRQEGPKFPSNFYLWQFVDINNDGFIDAFDQSGNFAATSPDAAIKADTSNGIIHLLAKPKSSFYTYRWQRNGRQIPNATTNYFTPKQPGLYTVQITDSCGNGVSLPYAYETNQKTLLDEPENKSTVPQFVAGKFTSVNNLLKAYPNPFSSSFILQLNNNFIAGKTVVRITDVEGRIVETDNVSNTTITLGSSLQKGIYIVQVIENNALIYQQKLIKE